MRATLGCGLEVLFPAWLQVGAHAFAAAFAAEAGFLVAAEADGGVEIVGAVDPDHAGLDLGRNVEGKIDVLAPDGGGEAVFGVVGEGHGLDRKSTRLNSRQYCASR